MIRTETDIEACRELWNRFSPGQDAWDDWDLMFAFHDQDLQRFNFLVHQDSGGDEDGCGTRIFPSSSSSFPTGPSCSISGSAGSANC